MDEVINRKENELEKLNQEVVKKAPHEEYETAFDIAKIALDIHVYSKDKTLIHTKVTTPAIEEAYAKNNK